MINSRILALLNQLAILFPVYLIIFTFRGFIRALAAKLMGDRTAEQEGFLSFNPLIHIDLIGLSIVLFGYALIGFIFSTPLPSKMFFLLLVTFGARITISAPINDDNFKNFTKGGIVTSLSGGFGNLILAIAATLLLKILFLFSLPSYVLVSLMGILTEMLDCAIFFGILYLIPIPPLDGGKLLHYIVPQSKYYILYWMEEYSLYIFLVLFFAPGISDVFLGILSMGTATIRNLLLGFII